MSTSFQHCTGKATTSCPLDATVLGYAPSKPWNIAYTTVFAICCIGQIVLGFRYKIKTYSLVVGLGCFAEVVGYGARIVLNTDPWDEWALGSQLIALVVGPGFLAAGIYLTLKHAMLSISTQSTFRVLYRPWVFVCCDIVSITMQAAGGAVASVANTDRKISASAGNTALLIGICLQAVTLLVFGVMAGLYAREISRYHALSPATDLLLRNRRFRNFVVAMSLGCLVLLIRCVYRIADMAGGWKNSVSRNEVSFMVLDGLMCIFAALAMTFIHPGIFFKAMSSGVRRHQIQVDQNNETNDKITV